MAVTEISGSSFKSKVLDSKGTVVVDFHADWCGPCNMLAPILEKLSDDVESVTIYGVDVDENSDLASEKSIDSIPCLIRYVDGKEDSRLIGLQSLPKLRKFVEGK